MTCVQIFYGGQKGTIYRIEGWPQKEAMHRWFTDDENVSQTSSACLRKGGVLSYKLYGL